MVSILKIISIQSPNADESCRRISQYLGQELGIRTEFISDLSWQEKEILLDSGEAHLGWICGLPYVRKMAHPDSKIELAAAPVMVQHRYQGKPIYFSDVIVRPDSHFQTFKDLKGASWAYNEPNSQSGYNITRYHLSTMGEKDKFFGRVVQSGSHLNSLELVLKGKIDASAIDSTVLEIELQYRPQLKQQFRIIEVLGPSPIPPWVVSTQLPLELRDDIREVFYLMKDSRDGKSVLEESLMSEMVIVQDQDYDIIRYMAQAAESVSW
jgi:phosphonate transport system substrate-binding protein